MIKNANVTFNEIAKTLGVSPASVSLAINGKGRLSEALRDRILEHAEQAGVKRKFQAKPLVFLGDTYQALQGKMSKFQIECFSGLVSAMGGERIPLRQSFLHADFAETPWDGFRQVLSLRPSGVIVDTANVWYPHAARFFEEHRVPVIVVGHYHNLTRQHAVVVDVFDGVYRGMAELIGRGHRRIAMIRWVDGKDYAQSASLRQAAYDAALADHGLVPRPEYIKEVQAQDELSARDRLAELAALKEPPTAVFVANGACSTPLIFPGEGDAAKRKHDRCRGMAFLHFEDVDLEGLLHTMKYWGGYPYPQNALFICPDWHGIGMLAGKLFTEMLKGREVRCRSIKVAPAISTYADDPGRAERLVLS